MHEPNQQPHRTAPVTVVVVVRLLLLKPAQPAFWWEAANMARKTGHIFWRVLLAVFVRALDGAVWFHGYTTAHEYSPHREVPDRRLLTTTVNNRDF